jgi:Lipopolysaccharide-assembly
MSLAKIKWGFITFFTGWCLIGCQYHFGRGELSQSYATISVPYAEGDQKGELTADVIKQLSTSGAFRYVCSGADLLLKIKIIEFREENIDFRYDRKKTGKLKNYIIPTETRVSAIAEVSLIEGATGRAIRGPTRITASTDFDHTYYTTQDEVNIFSLGQLNDIDTARDAVMHPLNRHLAERIVDYVINSW